MADISMCLHGCERARQCHRWTAIPEKYQSVSDFKPDEHGNCQNFWDNEGLPKRGMGERW